MLAIVDAVRSAAGVSAPIALGYLWDSRGVNAVLFALFALPVIGTLLYARALMRRRRSPHPLAVPR